MAERTPPKRTAERSYSVIGVMSGSSMDGIDLACCTLREKRGRWSYTIDSAKTIPIPPVLRICLEEVMTGSAYDLAVIDAMLGEFIGEECRRMTRTKVDLIASHGHTVFHNPRSGITVQVGSGACIAALSRTTTVCEFRTLDMALGGQGAPLVPMGEQLLFPAHKAFINLGGICNISVHGEKRVTGYDVCIGNQALNFLAAEGRKTFDNKGAIAASGNVHAALLDRLNALPFHQQKPPRSLGREWFTGEVLPLISDRRIPLPDRMRTVVEHIAQQLAAALKKVKTPVLVTGGGAHNTFLLERIKACTKAPIEVPDKATVNYKEALIFALLGVLRVRDEVNTLASVTGAKRDSVGGAVYSAN